MITYFFEPLFNLIRYLGDRNGEKIKPLVTLPLLPEECQAQKSVKSNSDCIQVNLKVIGTLLTYFIPIALTPWSHLMKQELFLRYPFASVGREEEQIGIFPFPLSHWRLSQLETVCQKDPLVIHKILSCLAVYHNHRFSFKSVTRAGVIMKFFLQVRQAEEF